MGGAEGLVRRLFTARASSATSGSGSACAQRSWSHGGQALGDQQVGRRVDLQGRRKVLVPRPGHRPEHRVDEARRRLRPHLPAEVHALAHRGVVGDAQVAQLVGPEAEDLAHLGVEAVHRPAGELAEDEVEGERPAQGAVDQLGGQRPVPGVDLPLPAQGRVEGHARKRTAGLHPHQQVEGEATGAGHAAPSRVPGASGRPAR